MTRAKSAVPIFLALILLGFGWPQGTQGEDAQEKSRLSSSDAKDTALEKAKSSGSPSIETPQVKTASSGRNFLSMQRSVDNAIKAGRLAQSVPSYEQEIVGILQQINEILAANEALRSEHQSQLEQIKKITDQAVMHRRMLQEIDSNRKDSGVLSEDDVSEILRQQKLRLIRNETEKSKAFLNALAENPSPSESTES